MQTTEIYALVEQDFRAADALIQSQLRSDVPLVETIGKYIVNAGGKRLRPLLVLLTSHALARPSEDSVKLATIIEFLHTATLLHDDVVDTSSMRRGNATANAKWGNAPSVLVGDFLYSRAFQMMVQLNSMPVLNVLANATNLIAEGEVLQLTNCKNPDITEATYIKVITAKTARLFEAATESAARLAGTGEELGKALAKYGCLLGIAFQLADDVLDYTGDPAVMGKNIGDDLAEGKPTLPLIEAQRRLDKAGCETIRQAIRKWDASAIDDILTLVRQSDSLPYTLQRASDYADEARKLVVNLLPDSAFRKALVALTDIAVNRTQ
jgi:octaprenyl-diphosphate synthase